MADFWTDIITTGAALASSYMANEKGSERARQGLQQANQVSEASKQRGIGAIRAGTADAQRLMGEVEAYGAPGANELRRQVTQSPYDFTPMQRIKLDDTGRQIRTRLAGSGLRGAGRAGVAVYNDGMQRAEAGMIESNLSRRDSAARTLGSNFTAGKTSQANLSADEGRQIANTEIGVGSQQAGRVAEAGNISGQEAVAQGRLVGGTIGEIGSIIADDEKQQRLRDAAAGASNFDVDR